MDPQPGWYDDPGRPGQLRWWDGRHWTEHCTPGSGAAPMVPITPAAHHRAGPAPGVTAATPPLARRRRSPWITLAAAVGATAILVLVTVVALAAIAGEGDVTAGVGDDAVATPDRGDSGGDGDAAGVEPATPSDTVGGRVIGTCDEAVPLTVPGTDITIEPLSRSQEAEIGAAVVDEVLATSTVADDAATQAVLEELLVEVRPDDGVDYRVTLLASDEVNAFAVPGGALFFTTAITDLMTDDELAFVMGHEVAHVHCRHSAQEIERVGLVAAAANAVFGTDLDAQDIYADAAAGTIAELASLSFSRDDELEADLGALDLLEGAGRPLSAGADALRRLQSLEGTYEPSRLDVLLSTHPPTQERIDAVEAAARD